ncbi:MAG: hypothetical protein HY721_12250 [Planctomycetes bacterium]|nr:hypothetical protein [Planctomycetota bacterium]
MPCSCERRLHGLLTDAGAAVFGGSAVAAVVASTMIAAARAVQRGDPGALAAQVRLVSVLLDDTRRREYHEHLERRLGLELDRAQDHGRDFLSVLLAAQGTGVPPVGPAGRVGPADAPGANGVRPGASPMTTLPVASSADPRDAAAPSTTPAEAAAGEAAPGLSSGGAL